VCLTKTAAEVGSRPSNKGLCTAQGRIDEGDMISLILITIVKSEIDNTCKMLGLPQNDQVSMALAKCIVTCMSNPANVEGAVEDLFNDCGYTKWRGKTLADALMQTLKGLPTASDPIAYLTSSFDNLTELRNVLTEFEDADEDDDDEYDDDED